MSWLFGIIGQGVNGESAARCRGVHADPLHVFEKTGTYYLAAGGFGRTCLAARGEGPEGKDSVAIALGSLFIDEGERQDVCTQERWERIAFRAGAEKALDGHYVCVRIDGDRCEVRTDRLGLRTFYWAQHEGAVVISSRLDWICRYVSRARIDFHKFGSRWLLFNALTYESPIEGIHRLGPSGRLEISPGAVRSAFEPFTPEFHGRVTPADYAATLRAVLHPALESGLRPSLGLSGGLDSRVLLALLQEMDSSGSYQTHTFGSAAEPDVRLANRIAGVESPLHHNYDAPLPAVHELERLLTDYVSQTHLAEPGSTILRLQHYAMLDSESTILVDGAFGEIARRLYLKRISLKGKGVVERCDTDAIADSIRYSKGRIFTPVIEERMASGMREEIRATHGAMPPLAEIGLGNYLDLWITRTRVPNFTCDEQARLDGLIVNDMPFIRPRVLDRVFSLPVSARKNAALFRRIIRMHAPRLGTYPLIKNNVSYPFILSSYPAMAWTMVKKKLGYGYRDALLDEYLEMMKELVLDRVHSRETAEYAPYDYEAVRRTVTGYYGGDRSQSMAVNWWLTFDVWRRTLEHG